MRVRRVIGLVAVSGVAACAVIVAVAVSFGGVDTTTRELSAMSLRAETAALPLLSRADAWSPRGSSSAEREIWLANFCAPWFSSANALQPSNSCT